MFHTVFVVFHIHTKQIVRTVYVCKRLVEVQGFFFLSVSSLFALFPFCLCLVFPVILFFFYSTLDFFFIRLTKHREKKKEFCTHKYIMEPIPLHLKMFTPFQCKSIGPFSLSLYFFFILATHFMHTSDLNELEC